MGVWVDYRNNSYVVIEYTMLKTHFNFQLLIVSRREIYAQFHKFYKC